MLSELLCYRLAAGGYLLERATVPDGSRSRYEVSGREEGIFPPFLKILHECPVVNHQSSFRPMFMRSRRTLLQNKKLHSSPQMGTVYNIKNFGNSNRPFPLSGHVLLVMHF
jgi:hypothetical protein